MFNHHDISRNACMLHGPLRRRGVIRLYDKIDGQLVPVDEMDTDHVGCEYGEYDE